MIYESITQMRVVLIELEKSDRESDKALSQTLTQLLDQLQDELNKYHIFKAEGLRTLPNVLSPLPQVQLSEARSFTLTNKKFSFSDEMIFFILDGVKQAGGYENALSYYEEEMTSLEYGDAQDFLNWLKEKDLTIGHGNIYDRINQWLDSKE